MHIFVKYEQKLSNDFGYIIATIEMRIAIFEKIRKQKNNKMNTMCDQRAYFAHLLETEYERFS